MTSYKQDIVIRICRKVLHSNSIDSLEKQIQRRMKCYLCGGVEKFSDFSAPSCKYDLATKICMKLLSSVIITSVKCNVSYKISETK